LLHSPSSRPVLSGSLYWGFIEDVMKDASATVDFFHDVAGIDRHLEAVVICAAEFACQLSFRAR
jgi:hypothetical protein